MKNKRQEAIQKATGLYWEKGFHATSMRNIQDVINMRPGSIYASFGSKEGLFKESLQQYADINLAGIEALREQATSPLGALRTLMERSVIESRQSAPNGMCMLVKTIAELTDENSELLGEAKRLLHDVEKSLEKIVDDAKACGEIDCSNDSARVARYFQVQLMGVRTYANSHDDVGVINQLIDDVFNSPLLRV